MFSRKRKFFPGVEKMLLRTRVSVCVCVRASGMLSREIFLLLPRPGKGRQRQEENVKRGAWTSQELFQSVEKKINCVLMWCWWNIFPLCVALAALCVCVCPEGKISSISSSEEKRFLR